MFYRSALAALLLAASAFAADPQLTTIQDVLYKADGTRFNGILVISWDTFQSADSSQIVTQSKTVRVANGNLYVQLVPSTTSTPAISYSVKYNSDGRIQFTETWSVPTSAQTLRVRDVRVDVSSDTTTTSDDTTVNESDVVGLIADLSARPLKGTAYAPGRVAVVNAGGAIDSVSGDASDCVRVDGSSGPCGTGQTVSFIDADSPAGLVDGANTVFTLSNVPSPVSSLSVYRNGLLQKVGQDYTVSSGTLTFVASATPQPGDTLLASYRINADDSGTTGSGAAYPAAQVLCAGTGGSTTATTMASLGVCNIPAGLLAAGDHVTIHFDFEHTGINSAFTYTILWGSTAILSRAATPIDALVAGSIDAGIVAAGAHLSYQSWGNFLVLGSGLVAASDSWANGITIDFQGMMAQAGETLKLASFAVVRLP